jgi:hypothetical protein
MPHGSNPQAFSLSPLSGGGNKKEGFDIMLNIFKSIFDENKKTIKRYQEMVARINVLEAEMEKLSDRDFAGKTAEFKDQTLGKGETLNDILTGSLCGRERSCQDGYLACACLMSS